jgi:hypothetical protein
MIWLFNTRVQRQRHNHILFSSEKTDCNLDSKFFSCRIFAVWCIVLFNDDDDKDGDHDYVNSSSNCNNYNYHNNKNDDEDKKNNKKKSDLQIML